jgi:calcium-dependent protein kinase
MGCAPSCCRIESGYVIKPNGAGTSTTMTVVDEKIQEVSGKNHESFSARVHNSSRKLDDDYVVEKSKVVGSGYSGPVRAGVSKLTHKKVAIKSFNKKALNAKRIEFLRNEVSVYLLLDHPNVARLLDVYEDEQFVHLVMEYCAGKELYHRLVKKTRYSERDAAKATYEMLIAINYLHQHNIVHRDIKLENFLYEDGSEDATLKLIDFGFSRVWDPQSDERLQASCGSIQYVSPEVISSSGYDSQCDLWSLGVIVYMLLSGQPPFDGFEDEVLENIRLCRYSLKGQKWKNISSKGKDFVSKLLVVDPKQRMTAAEALNHPWITEVGSHPEVEVPRDVLENLRDFAQQNHLRRAALSMLAYTLTSDEITDLHDVFLSIDNDKEGTIQLSELLDVMKTKLNISEEEVGNIFGKLDRSHQGKIEYTTFLAATVASRMRLHEDLIRHVFNQLDHDRDGKISLNDLQSVLGETVDGEDIGIILIEADADGDGLIDYEEFEKCFKMIGPLPDPVSDETEFLTPPPIVRSISRQQSIKMTLTKLRAVSALSRATRNEGSSLAVTCSESVAPSPMLEPVEPRGVSG